MGRKFLFDIMVYLLSAFLVITPLALIFHAPQWVIDATMLGIIVAAVNGIHTRVSYMLGGNAIMVCAKTEDGVSDKNEWQKEAEVFKKIEEICKDNGYTVIVPVKKQKNVEQENTVEK